MSHRGETLSCSHLRVCVCARICLIGRNGWQPLLYFCLICHCEYDWVKWPKFVVLPQLPAALALLNHLDYKQSEGERYRDLKEQGLQYHALSEERTEWCWWRRMWRRETNARAQKCCTSVRDGPREGLCGGESTVASLNSCQAHWLFELLQMAQTIAAMWLAAHYRMGETNWYTKIFILRVSSKCLLFFFFRETVLLISGPFKGRVHITKSSMCVGYVFALAPRAPGTSACIMFTDHRPQAFKKFA